jgi:indole-3-glycerol phosphate synthase
VSVLSQIVAQKREEVRERRSVSLIADLRARVSDMPGARGFEKRLRVDAHPVALIAEVKKASPSKGIIAPDFDPTTIARAYQSGGASCISVLTDRDYFQGSVDDLVAVRLSVDLPVLRKDFVVDELCVLETRDMGADCMLLIAAALSTMQLQDYCGLASEIGLDVLVEAHDADELGAALNSGAALIGINNRDLSSFVTDLRVTESLVPLAAGRFVVSESGIASREDVERVTASGAKAVLVGESLMLADDPAAACRRLLGK